MDWNAALKQAVLTNPDDAAHKQMQRFVLERIPVFEAPTDVRQWRRERERIRAAALRDVYLRGFSRKEIDGKPRVVWGDVLRPDPSYVIRKLRYEIYPDYWVPALLYEPARLRGKVPVMLNPNGHHSGGKATGYKQARCANLARRGVIALSTEFIGMGELEADRNHNDIAFLDLTGVAGVGLFYLTLKKALDVLVAHKHADWTRVGCTGLSGGGWQTIVISALDERITLSVPVAGYTGARFRVDCMEDLGDMEQTPCDMTTALDYQHMTAMLAPRPALLILNQNDDCCFKTDRTKPVIYDAIVPTYRAMGAESKFRFYSNLDPGTHNYGPDNRSQLYRFLNEHWGLDAPVHDTHRPEELLPEHLLYAGLPPEQQTMRSIAVRRGRELTKKNRLPRTAAAKERLRRQIAEVLRLPDYEVTPPSEFPSRPGVSNEVITVGPWSVPASFLVRGAGTRDTELVVNDGGRAAGPALLPPVETAHRVVIDPLATGECHANYLVPMLLDCAGERLLGIRVAQVLAVARWLKERTGAERIDLIGDGPISSFTLLLAAGLRPNLFRSLTVQANLTQSLTSLVQWGHTYESVQPIMCFGLLEVTDIPHVRALMDGVLMRAPGREVPEAKPEPSENGRASSRAAVSAAALPRPRRPRAKPAGVVR